MIAVGACDTEAAELLTTCLHDLALAAGPFAELIDELAPVITERPLQAVLETLRDTIAVQAEQLGDAVKSDGPDNLWMPGIIGDARRDAATQGDPWARDVALIGAVRKGLAALIVSYETAAAIAALIDEPAPGAGVNQRSRTTQYRDETHDADTQLAQQLGLLTRRRARKASAERK